jgi:Undecaprenyl-phosphate glucose phosphotransferase
MVKGRLNMARLSLRFITFLLPTAAFALAGYVRFYFAPVYVVTTPIDVFAYIGLLLVATIMWALVVEHYHVCDLEQIFASSGKTKRTLVACSVTYCGVLAAAFFYRHVTFSRLFIFVSAVFLFFLATLMRLVFRVFLTWRINGHGHYAKILIIGTDDFAHRVARSLRGGQVVPCKIVGFVRLPGQTILVNGCPIYELNDVSNLALANEKIDDVVLAISPTRFADVANVLTQLKPISAPVRMVLDLGDNILIQEKLFNFGGTMMLDLLSTPAETPSYLVQKRIFDVVFSVLIVVLAAPLFVLIAIAIKLTSRGPVIFSQERVGLNGNAFRMYKFRTMEVSRTEDSDTRWTTPDDSRRTKVGAILRRYNLDELPQFFNVLKGDMSIVGPRPERLHFVKRFLQDVDSYNTRHVLKVGITGWAQVNGWRGDTSINKRIECDLYYLRNWSITFDLQIMLLTIFRGFFDENAY